MSVYHLYECVAGVVTETDPDFNLMYVQWEDGRQSAEYLDEEGTTWRKEV